VTDSPLLALYHSLHAHYGALAWWPAESAFEIAVGAILTQNTDWRNVEKALGNLKSANVLSIEAILETPTDQLEMLVRPSGYFRMKADRLKQLCDFLQSNSFDALKKMGRDQARERLLSVKGVGPETADDIVLYALDIPSFVIDTYTRRLLERFGLYSAKLKYSVLQAAFHQQLPEDASLFKQYHALIVEHAKVSCRKKPLCETCALNETCPQII
jgi:endonuclease-3 related protein